MAESGQVVVRPEGQATCVHHKGRTLELFCEKCQDIACTKCVTSVHKGHTMSDLSDMTSTISEDIRRFVTDTEGNKLPQSQRNIRSTIDELKTNSENFDNLAEKAKNQAARLKQDIDVMTAETLSLYHQLKEDNARMLSNYKCELEEGETKMHSQLQECKRVLQTASDVTLFDARDKVQRFCVQFPDKPILRTASFDPTRSYRGFLEKAFGTRTTSGEAGGQASSDSAGKKQSFPNKTQIQQTSEYALLPGSRVLGKGLIKFLSSYGLCCKQSKQAYLCYPYYKYSKLQLLDTEFKETSCIHIDYSISALSISRKTNHVWATCDNGHSIIELKSGSPIIRFHTKDKPQCLCATMDNHVLVGTTGCITKFSMNGKVVLTTDKAKSKKGVVSDPYKIRECRVTNNVAVIDADYTGDVPTYKVLVLDKDLQLLFYYFGVIPNGQHCKGQPFSPCSVAFDSVGNIAIADDRNFHILLVDGKGNFIRIIHTSETELQLIDIDDDNVLWVMTYAHGGTEIERLQYCTC